MSGLFTILSPAKSLQMDGADEAACRFEASKPRFSPRTRALVEELRGRSPRSLESLMSISTKLAGLNAERWQQFGGRSNPRCAAAMCFRGDVYQGFEAWTMDKRALGWAQDHVRILSGLYGLLRPLDTIQPYRLEMGTRLPTDAGKDLYTFWGKRLSRALKQDMEAARADTLINLASDEYSKAAQLKELGFDVLDVKFLQKQGGEQKLISIFAKRARGLMARWMADNRPRTVSELSKFNLEGYRFQAKEGNDELMVFSRPRPAAASKKAG
ncbi:MAG: peroxide stress protein YaaA [Planctomycetes bacterium]|nr:peroxide stress protein YaaA [Planctomycetota bacterium]